MISRRRGSIVNISSCAAFGGWPMRSAHNAATAGVVALTKVLAVEWAEHNVRVRKRCDQAQTPYKRLLGARGWPRPSASP